MEPSGALPARNRSTVLFAILAIALLFIGIGAGYYVGRPATASLPGPVEGLARTSAVPRVDGWFRNRDVFYSDEGTRPPADGWVVQAAPIYAFFHADGTPVAGQRNVIDALPGSPGYSDLWNVVKVVVDASYVANSLKDARSILEAHDAGQLSLESTDVYVNCPVVS